MTNASKPATTAAEKYAVRRNEIVRLIDVLQMELERDAKRAKADPNNWGFVGNLGKVRGDLIDTIAFLSQMEPADVEAFLDDAE